MSSEIIHHEKVLQAGNLIKRADALLITAGAGMGVDSGLPDFRGDEGFWKAYPPYASKGLSFVEMANPQWFTADPAFAWGFYGHRLELYRATEPHHGFHLLRQWGEAKKHGYFVFTSNVDGHFQKAGFSEERIEEVHGSLNHLQCSAHCGLGIISADSYHISIDESTMRAIPPLPQCPRCGALLRPNVLMFGDWDFDGARQSAQGRVMRRWLNAIGQDNVVIIEIGAGRAVPTVRMTSEAVAKQLRGVLIRINIREPEVPPEHISFSSAALPTLKAIEAALQGSHY